jgi:hypothetical protein
MKKLMLIFTGLIAVTLLNAQSLDEIIKKYTASNKLDQMSKLQTIKITGKISMPAMGMEMPLEIWSKNPNKIKTVSNVNGQEVVSAFDGEKGYMINPINGSATPVEMQQAELNNIKSYNMFQNQLATYYKEGKLALEGEEAVNGSPAYKIKANIDAGTSSMIYIDKSSFRIVKNSVSSSSQGMPVTVDTYPGDYQEINGIVIAMKTTMSTQGMEISMIFTKVDINVPMDDKIFKLK